MFGSTANGCPSVYMPIPNRYYEAVRGRSPPRLESIAASNRFYPVTDKVRQVDYHGGFTAAAGHALYTARTYPRQYWNQTAFVAEPTGHLVATFTLERKGSDVADYYGWNLLASDDEWTAPISAEVGPDGHVWVIDWYNYIVQHNPTPHGFKTGRGNAYETPLRDKTHGRIYRVVYKDAQPAPPPALDRGRPESLVAALRERQPVLAAARPAAAGRAGQDRRRAGAGRAGGRSVGRRDRPERRRDPRPLDAARPGCAGGFAIGRCAGRRGGAQASVGRRSPQRGAGLAARRAHRPRRLLAAGLLRDPDAQVRLAALLCLADQPPSDDVAACPGRSPARRAGDDGPVAGRRRDGRGCPQRRRVLEGAGKPARDGPPAPLLSIAERVAEHWARGGPSESAGQFLAGLAGGEPAVNESILRGAARGWPQRSPRQG